MQSGCWPVSFESNAVKSHLNLKARSERISDRMRRRAFLASVSRAALAFPFFPLLLRAEGNQTSGQLNDRKAWDALIANLETQIPKWMEDSILPGLSMLMMKDAKVFWRRGFGFRDSASKAPVDNDTLFEAGSVSKTVFAYAVMKLCEKGIMDLDTPLTHYTSERFLEGDPRLELITARRVLSHTSGFQNWRSEKKPLQIQFNPGEKFSYSGEGYSYLQSVLTHLTGQPIEAYMKANIFVPFGMASTGYIWNEMFDKHAARPHDREGKPFPNKKRTAQDVARYAAAGDLHTTPTDYAKFLIEVIEPKKPDAFRLNQKSLTEMVRPQVKVNDSTSWALGWEIEHTPRGNFIGHGGDNKGFHAFAVASPEHKSGYIIMTNGDNGTDVLKKVMETINRFLTT